MCILLHSATLDVMQKRANTSNGDRMGPTVGFLNFNKFRDAHDVSCLRFTYYVPYCRYLSWFAYFLSSQRELHDPFIRSLSSCL